ncbi:MAG: YfhO family protein [Candidatus Omnitrophica bacterium]|nr:YfhO family protein [Candidatus Omnitrophota bacterium]
MRNFSIKKRHEILFITAIILFFVISFHSLLFTGQRTFSHDTLWFYGLFHYFSESLQNGFFPYWNPYDYSGQPFYNDISIMDILNPVTITLIFIGKLLGLSLLLLFHWNLIIRIIIINIGVYLAFRQINRHRSSTLIIFAVFLGSSFTFASLRQSGLVYSLSWLPWSLWFFFRLLRKTSVFNVVGFSLFTGFALTGYQGIFVVVFLLFFIPTFFINERAFFRSFIRLRAKDRGSKAGDECKQAALRRDAAEYIEGGPRRSEAKRTAKGFLDTAAAKMWCSIKNKKNAIIYLACALIIIGGLSLQLFALFSEKDKFIPMARIMTSPNGKAAFDSAEGGVPSEFQDLLGLVNPSIAAKGYFKNNSLRLSEGFLYIGIIPLLLVFLGLFASKDKWKPNFIIITLVMLALMFGQKTGFRNLLNAVFPPFKFARHTFLFSGFFIFSLMYFLGQGVDKALDGAKSMGRKSVFLLVILLLTVSDIFLYGRETFDYVTIKKPDIKFSEFAENTPMIGKRRSERLVTSDYIRYYRPVLYKKFTAFNACTVVPYYNEGTLALGLYALYTGVREDGKFAFNPEARTKKVADFIKYAIAEYNTWPDREKKAFRDIVSIVKSETMRNRQNPVYKQVIKNLSMTDFLAYTWGNNHSEEFTILQLKQYKELLDIFMPLKRNASSPDRLILRFMGVRADIVRFYDSAVFAPRAYIKKTIHKDPGKDVLYIESASLEDGKPESYTHEKNFYYEITSYNPNDIKLRASSGVNGYLYFSDGYDSHWRAKVDGMDTKVYRADLGFKAIKLPRGMHEVEFRYVPQFFRCSLFSYYLTALVCLIFLIGGALVRKV